MGLKGYNDLAERSRGFSRVDNTVDGYRDRKEGGQWNGESGEGRERRWRWPLELIHLPTHGKALNLSSDRNFSRNDMSFELKESCSMRITSSFGPA